tara:strand:- start:5782 stop:6423 length:642 start_codon:yes stop_codon:yes gene_type:complete
MDFSNYAQPWQEKKQQQTRIPIKANDRFFFAHFAENWELVTFETTQNKKKVFVPMLLPLLSSIPETAGVNGCRTSGGRIDSSVMKAQMIQAGWNIIEPNQIDYLRTYPAIQGNYYTSKWTKLEKVGSRMISTFNHAEFNEWRRELMETQYISAPHPQIARLLLIDQNREITKLEQNQHIPEIAVRLKSAQNKYNGIKKAISNIEKKGVKAYSL